MNPFDFSVSLRVFSNNIDPSEVSSTLGLEAEGEHRKGEPRRRPDGVLLKGVYEANYCSYHVKRHGDEELHETLARFTDSLMKHKDVFRKIFVDGGKAEYFIGWFTFGDSGDIFKHDLLGKLGALHIDLALAVYGDTQPTTSE